MEITLEAIISFIGLFLGGGGGAFFTWRWMNRRDRAEAKEKESEAKSAEVDMDQKAQDTYQQMLEDKQKEVDDNHRLIAERDCDVNIQTMSAKAFDRLSLSNDWSFAQIDELEAELVEKKNGE